jgi:glycerol-3-phosphate dehydrogenase
VSSILRQPDQASRDRHDLIIIGGGIYGVMFALEASLHGLHALLLEKNDFGGATSFNSLRIIHGGLRYLQRLDLHRFHESVQERRWFLQCFPDFVEPLPCLMPLYGIGLQRPSILRAALGINDVLSRRRNRYMHPDKYLPGGRIVSAIETKDLFPAVNTSGLLGGAIWYDACMPNSQRLLMDVLRWSCAQGTTALNYVEAKELIRVSDRVSGIIALDRETNERYEYRARIVVNATGPRARKMAMRLGASEPRSLENSLAWNVLFDREAPSQHALAVTPRRRGAQTYFLCPWKGKLLVGTGHIPPSDRNDNLLPTDGDTNTFLADINDAVPALQLGLDDVVYVFSGLLPAKRGVKHFLAVRETIIDHGKHGGPSGLFTVSGVKFTAARLVAEKTLRLVFDRYGGSDLPLRTPWSPPTGSRGIYDIDWFPHQSETRWQKDLQSLIAEESVVHLDDLILRRTTLWDNPDRALSLAPAICKLFDWSEERSKQEIHLLREKLKGRFMGQHGRESEDS